MGLVEKAIKVEELKKDLQGLMQQAAAVNGAIQYINAKIAELTKPDPKPEDKDKPDDKKQP